MKPPAKKTADATTITAGLRRLRVLLPENWADNPHTFVPLWSILTRTMDENTHSSILRWLLDPRESHGLRDKFLKEFYRRVFDSIPPDTAHATVRTEVLSGSERIDIMVIGRGWRLLIENKIQDHNDRTLAYGERWKHSDCVFLTPDGRKPQSLGFRPVRYRVIREILDGLEANGEAGVLVRAFADHIACDLEQWK